MKRCAGLAGLFGFAAQASAHGAVTSPEVPGWSFEPGVLIPLGLAALLFSAGWLRLRSRSASGRVRLNRSALLFGAGWAIVGTALISPLHELGERSFAAHMFEHELLMLAGAPLLVLARPLPVMLWAFPAPVRAWLGQITNRRALQGAWETASGPVFATLLQATVLWLWHAPALFDRALASDTWHIAQHSSFLAASLLFWSAMLARSTPRGLAAVCLFATSLVSGALGALMVFAVSTWYWRYAALGMAPLGLSPAEDQQLAGLLMWIPGGMVHAAVALAIANTMLASESGTPHAR